MTVAWNPLDGDPSDGDRALKILESMKRVDTGGFEDDGNA